MKAINGRRRRIERNEQKVKDEQPVELQEQQQNQQQFKHERQDVSGMNIPYHQFHDNNWNCNKLKDAHTISITILIILIPDGRM